MNLENLKIARESKGYNQKQLAYELGISQQRYNHYESGKREPDISMLLLISKKLDIDPNYLIDSNLDSKNNKNTIFSEKLKELRQNKNLTQKELAELISVSPSTIAMWETDKREPDFDTLKKLADYFNVSTDYLLGRVDDSKISHEKESDEKFKSDSIAWLVEEMRKLGLENVSEQNMQKIQDNLKLILKSYADIIEETKR